MALHPILDLSHICAAPSARLGHLVFEGQGAFAFQCRMTTLQDIEAIDALEDGCLISAVGLPGARQDQSTSERGNCAEDQKQKTSHDLE